MPAWTLLRLPIAVATGAVLMAACSAGDAADQLSTGSFTTPSATPSASAAASPGATASPPTRTPTPTPTPTPAPPSASPVPSTAPPAPTTAPSPEASDPPAPGPGLQADDRFTVFGVGPLKVGMTYAEAERATGLAIEVNDPLETGGACVYPFFPDLPAGQAIGMLGEDGRVKYLAAGEGTARLTRSGIAVGDPVAKVQQVYGDALTERPHPYTQDDGSYLTLRPAGSPYELLLETHQGRVTTFRVGFVDQVEYIEGCA